MSELQELKALLCESGLSKHKLLREIIDAVTNDGNMERCSKCHGGCINCEVGCNTGPAR